MGDEDRKSVRVTVACESEDTFHRIEQCLACIDLPMDICYCREPEAFSADETDHTGEQMLEVVSEGAKRLFYREQILYLERTDRTVNIHLADGSVFPVYQSLNQMRTILGDGFLKCNGSYVVNMKMVVQKVRDHLLLKDGTELMLSRTFRDEICKWFQTEML